MGKKARNQFGLLTRSDELVHELRRLIGVAVKKWDTDAIHDARVATRRLKGMMDVLEPLISRPHRKPFNRLLRKLRQRLGPMRDADVMLGHLDKFPGHAPARKWVSEQLKHEQRDLRILAANTIDPPKIMSRMGTWWGVREELVACQQGTSALVFESLHAQLDAFVQSADGLVSDRPKDPAGVADPHAVRIAGKQLRYTLEMAQADGQKLPAAVIRSFKQMQDALGLWHDYVVLAEKTLKLSLESHLARHDPQLQAGVLEIARQSVRRSAQSLDRFSQVWRERGQDLASVIRQRIPARGPKPAAQRVSEPTADRDPSNSEQHPLPLAAPSSETSAA